MHDSSSHGDTQTIEFPRETAGLPEARQTELVELADGDEFELEIVPVKKRIGDATVRMLAYNGSVPGPTLKVPQGATITVHVDERRRHRGDRALARPAAREPLRRHARDAGADPGRRDASPTRCTFPDPGAYWYHPHIREDYGQEMGLYGNILVDPERARLLAAGQPRTAAHARRHPDRRRPDRRLQRRRRRRTSRWAASAT